MQNVRRLDKDGDGSAAAAIVNGRESNACVSLACCIQA